ncbi:MAG: dihydroneopterin aldolase [Haliea sp.]|mgnify:FL=1|jgi:dihydroneopterin aldolase|nr:dihydroneopterin aldolase [Haliea sp.]
MNTVYIKGLRAQAVIGVYDWERLIRQPLVMDLEMASDTARAAATDAIADALDYAAISQQVIALVEGSEFQLLESLADAIATMVMREFGVPWLRLRLGKPGAVAEAEDVGVIVEAGVRA